MVEKWQKEIKIFLYSKGVIKEHNNLEIKNYFQAPQLFHPKK